MEVAKSFAYTDLKITKGINLYVSEDMDNKKRFIEIKDNKIPYTLVRTRRRTIGITIDINGEVKVSAPLRVSERQIKEILHKKADWIARKLNEVTEKNSNITCRQFVSGESLPYLGKEYVLEIEEKDLPRARVSLDGGVLYVSIAPGLSSESRKQEIQEALIKWYRQRFSEVVKERIEKYSSRVNAAPNRVVIKDQKTIWGSCSKKGNINLNWKLVMAPPDIIDYVIVHELCHLKFMNHSKDFWGLVQSVIPDYNERRKWLRENGHMLGI